VQVLIAGGGIGGLTTAMALHARGIDTIVFETVPELQPLGVGINVLPHAMAQLDRLDLLPTLVPLGVQTAELCFFNRHGQLIWREPRGTAAGHPVPQLSVHRGLLHMALLATARARLGEERVITGHTVTGLEQTATGVRVHIDDRADGTTRTVDGDVLIGADGIHSAVRRHFHPDEGLPRWSGNVLWRATTRARGFLTGRSMFMAGHLPHKFVAYPLTEPDADGMQTINWIAELDRRDVGLADREDWNRQGVLDDFLPRFADWVWDWLDVPGLIRGAEAIYEFPMVDRDPLDRWTVGRVTLLGDAAHPMYPIGSNGASQAIIDALTIADLLGDAVGAGGKAGARSPVVGSAIDAALEAYDALRRPATAAIVLSNRRHGPEVMLDIAEQRSPDGFDDVTTVFAPGEREEITGRYQRTAGFVPPATPAR
jgi:2-polyprenyl-6-methoxyphenol hydroxylase-like FAD-dependent oxidoreductase